jgi:hypothetical protein
MSYDVAQLPDCDVVRSLNAPLLVHYVVRLFGFPHMSIGWSRISWLPATLYEMTKFIYRLRHCKICGNSISDQNVDIGLMSYATNDTVIQRSYPDMLVFLHIFVELKQAQGIMDNLVPDS